MGARHWILLSTLALSTGTPGCQVNDTAHEQAEDNSTPQDETTGPRANPPNGAPPDEPVPESPRHDEEDGADAPPPQPPPREETDAVAPATQASHASDVIYDREIVVSLTASEPATIFFALDRPGHEEATFEAYQSPILVRESAVLRFYAVDEAGNREEPRAELYRIDLGRPLLLNVAAQ